MTPIRRWVANIEVTIAVVSWGATFVATKIALQEVQPVTVVWLRFGIGLLILGAVVLARRQFSLPSLSDLGYLAVIGFIGITFHQWLQSTGMVTSQATTTAWIVATTPVFMALLGWLALKERLNKIQLAGIGVAAFGVLLVVTKGDLSSLAAGKVGVPGDWLILLSAPNWAVFSALSRRGLRKFPATLMIFYVMLFGWLFTTILLLAGPGFQQIPSLTISGWQAVAVLGVFGSGLAYIFWYDALQAMPVAQAGAFVYLEPFVTVVVAGLVLQEPFTWASLAGGLTILLGVWLVNRADPAVQTQAQGSLVGDG
jgi:drug/metabolite transporter (DMT)-like permease